jgi:micrococcal nuclease
MMFNEGSRRATWLLVLAGAAILLGTPAFADPCKAIPDKGPMPLNLRPGTTFGGPVVYVGDGDSLCVGVGLSPSEWVEVRIADFYAPELNSPAGRAAKEALVRIAMGRRVVCRAGKRSYDRVIARCTLQGVSLGDRMRAAGVPEGGRGWSRED